MSAAVGERERWREREKERDKGRGEKKSAEHASVCAHPAEHALAHSRACIGTRIRCIGTRISRGWTRVYSTENAHTRQVNAANACMCIAHGRHHSSTPCRCGRSSVWLGWILGVASAWSGSVCFLSALRALKSRAHVRNPHTASWVTSTTRRHHHHAAGYSSAHPNL